MSCLCVFYRKSKSNAQASFAPCVTKTAWHSTSSPCISDRCTLSLTQTYQNIPTCTPVTRPKQFVLKSLDQNCTETEDVLYLFLYIWVYSHVCLFSSSSITQIVGALTTPAVSVGRLWARPVLWTATCWFTVERGHTSVWDVVRPSLPMGTCTGKWSDTVFKTVDV